MTTQELKDAVKALNDSGLIEKKIKIVAVKAVDMEKAFVDAVKSIPEEKEDDIPDIVVDVYNSIMKETGEVKQVSVQTALVAKAAPPEKKKSVETNRKGEKLSFLESLVAKGEFTKKELIDRYVEKYEGSPSTPATLLADGKNPKYNRFSHLIVEKDTKLSFEV
jgi:hypothetical protein